MYNAVFEGFDELELYSFEMMGTGNEEVRTVVLDNFLSSLLITMHGEVAGDEEGDIMKVEGVEEIDSLEDSAAEE